jgi:hypothetical protein
LGPLPRSPSHSRRSPEQAAPESCASLVGGTAASCRASRVPMLGAAAPPDPSNRVPTVLLVLSSAPREYFSSMPFLLRRRPHSPSSLCFIYPVTFMVDRLNSLGALSTIFGKLVIIGGPR